MTKEIVEAVTVLEKEKGIDGEILLTALEDALLAAYKKTPGAAPHAKVELDRDTGDIRVLESPIELPALIETLWWHPRATADPAHAWLRTRISEVANTLITRSARA